MIDWAPPHARILEADPRGSRIVVRRMTTVALPEPTEATPDAARQAIERELESCSKGAQVVCLVGRSGAVLRDLKLPDAPPDEMSGLVQFQAIRELSFPIEQAAIDYDVVGPPDADGQRRVLLAALQLEVVERYRAVARTAGLVPSRLGLRPYATWRTYRQAAVLPDGAVLVISMSDESVELTVARGEAVLFSRATTLRGGADAKSAAVDLAPALVAEVRRTLAAFANQLPGVAVERIALAAGRDQHASVGDALAAALSIPVDRFDPFQAAELSAIGPADDPGSFVAAIGAALSANEPWPIDFLNPKKPIVPRDRRKPMAVLAAAAVVLLVAGSYTVAQIKLASGRRQIADLTKLQAKLKEDVAKGTDVIRKKRDVERWINSGVDCLDELHQLTEEYPDTREMYTTVLVIARESSVNGATKIDVDGLAKQTATIGKFQTKLNKGDRYRAQPMQSALRSGGGAYPNSFKTHIVVKSAEDASDDEPENRATTPKTGTNAVTGKAASSAKQANPLQTGSKSNPNPMQTKKSVNKK